MHCPCIIVGTTGRSSQQSELGWESCVSNRQAGDIGDSVMLNPKNNAWISVKKPPWPKDGRKSQAESDFRIPGGSILADVPLKLAKPFRRIEARGRDRVERIATARAG